MLQVLVNDVILAVILALFVLVAVLTIGASISYRDALSKSRIVPFAQLLFSLLMFIVLAYFLIINVLGIVEFGMMFALLILNLLCFDWSKLRSKKDEKT